MRTVSSFVVQTGFPSRQLGKLRTGKSHLNNSNRFFGLTLQARGADKPFGGIQLAWAVDELQLGSIPGKALRICWLREQIKQQ